MLVGTLGRRHHTLALAIVSCTRSSRGDRNPIQRTQSQRQAHPLNLLVHVLLGLAVLGKQAWRRVEYGASERCQTPPVDGLPSHQGAAEEVG
ncbi:hypothetical protein BCR44DRAFT_1442814 [Catenaria anguillulae PL171]|uniref:Uncharacterized protein n=1 Tax=Catenaria anguillulae PL171 TaxID=765915 RepID=A0A1Y2HBC5_9FUNG|nr:hypothetical protein BCR44DRAFT_1442814 [Catenaria anguillulae PL171]